VSAARSLRRRIGLVQRVALVFVVVLALVGAFLWWRGEPSRGSEREGRTAAAAETAAPSQVLLPAVAPPIEAEPAPLGPREEAPGTSRAPVRGQLVRAEDGSLLREQKLLLLASAENRVTETLTTDARGAFTSTRAFPRGELRAWVKDPESKATLTKHAAPFEPGSEAAWLVPVPAPQTTEPAEPERVPLVVDDDEALVRVRIVDLEGRPREDVLLRFVPEEDQLSLAMAETDGQGRAELVLFPGRYRIVGGALGARLEPTRVALSVGENELGTLVLPVSTGSAFLAGTVHGVSEESDPFGVVYLRELESGRTFAAHTVLFGTSDGEENFRIEGLAPGPYQVSFMGLDGLEYLPAALDCVAPAEGLIFRASAGKPLSYRFEVLTSGGSPAQGARVYARFKGRWMQAADEGDDEVPAGFGDEWLVLADGCRPRRGRFPQEAPIVEQDEEGRDIALVRVLLEPGHGEVVLCLDVEGEGPLDYLGSDVGVGVGLAGVDLRIDGARSATSDADGLIVLDVERAPERIELVKPGWRLLERRDEEGMPLALFARQSP